jgi:hypothetical protein
MSVLHVVVFMNRFPDVRARFDQSSNHILSVDTLKAEQRHNFQPQAVADAPIDEGKEEDLRE